MLCFILSLVCFHFFSFPIREFYSGVSGNKDVLIFVCVFFSTSYRMEENQTFM